MVQIIDAYKNKYQRPMIIIKIIIIVICVCRLWLFLNVNSFYYHIAHIYMKDCNLNIINNNNVVKYFLSISIFIQEKSSTMIKEDFDRVPRVQ